MSSDRGRLSLPSLAQHFDAPEGYVGHFGWICGYSADAPFLNDAAERFTAFTKDQRASQGHVALALIVDPGHPPIGFIDAPGIAHLAILEARDKPFRLLHAKVALLGYRHLEQRDRWRLRLVVATGNWTRQTLEDSLDLAWRVEVDSDSLAQPAADDRRACADIGAAQGLLGAIRAWFDTRLLDAPPSGSEHVRLLDAWMARCAAEAAGEPRFFDNRHASLLSQLPTKVKAESESGARNYLAMGSGFYESGGHPSEAPSVPIAAIRALKEASLLTRAAEVDLFVNRLACQAVASSVQALEDQGVKVRPAAAPSPLFGDNSARTLHAKFPFSAKYASNAPRCNGAWIYLGSGNLTGPGFANAMSASSGNLEAGVVFAPGPLYWHADRGIEAHQVVGNLLPIQWTEAFDGSTVLSAGDPFERPETLHTAPPVAWLAWCETGDGGFLSLPAEVLDHELAFQVLTPEGIPGVVSGGTIPWTGRRPRVVRCRWNADGTRKEADIPVIDEFGRIAAAKLMPLGIDEGWWQLADFPLVPIEETANDDPDSQDDHPGEPGGEGGRTLVSSYSIRQMMELIENIAEKQTGIDRRDWEPWCRRLEQTLVRMKDSGPVAYFRMQQAPKLNPLSPLRCAPFRPSFAETAETSEGRLYEEALRRIELSWGVDEMVSMGELR